MKKTQKVTKNSSNNKAAAKKSKDPNKGKAKPLGAKLAAKPSNRKGAVDKKGPAKAPPKKAAPPGKKAGKVLAKAAKPLGAKVGAAKSASGPKKSPTTNAAQMKGAKAATPAKKSATAPAASAKAKKDESEVLKTRAPDAAADPSVDKADKSASAKGKDQKRKGKEDEEFLEDEFETFEGGDDEILEYEDELEEVEEEIVAAPEESEEVTWTLETKDRPNDEEVILTDAEGRRYCRAKDCDKISEVESYCRYHYLFFWKKIQVRKKILADGKLIRYVEELTARYPDKFLEVIRRDLRTEKDFLSIIQEMEIDEGATDNEFEEDTQSFIDEVRGMGEATQMEEEEF